MYRKLFAVPATVALVAGSLSLLPAATATAASTTGPAVHLTLLLNPGDTAEQFFDTLMSMYQKTHPGSTLTVEHVGQTELDQKLTLLSAANDLPSMFEGPNSPAQQGQMGKDGLALDIQTATTKLGVFNDLKPQAVKILDKLEGGLYAIPNELDIEGFWYNKKIFAEYKIQPPTTWAQMVSDAAALSAKGVTPFAASGQQGWPLTRLISAYLYRDLGPDAMLNVAEGKAKLTDPEYVKAAQAVADLGAKGYFGKGFATMDYSTAEQVFLQGKAAMFYMGSWVLADYANPSLDAIGANNIGFFRIPVVSGGVGLINQTPTLCGDPIMFSAKAYTPAEAPWLKFVAQNMGTVALEQGGITGFVSSPSVKSTPLINLVLQQIAQTGTPILWFEALFNAKATSVSQLNAARLIDGSLSPSGFMATVQAAIANS
jgi:raffinose/stachyose/melibiose transport system substrate-binding protein